jgi:type VI secretion system protein VasG
LRKVFPAAFLGRLSVVPYYPLSSDVLAQVVALKLSRIKNRILNNHNATFVWDGPAVSAIMAKATELESGGRMIDAILSNNVLPEISRTYLNRVLEGVPLKAVNLTAENGELKLQFAED